MNWTECNPSQNKYINPIFDAPILIILSFSQNKLLIVINEHIF